MLHIKLSAVKLKTKPDKKRGGKENHSFVLMLKVHFFLDKWL